MDFFVANIPFGATEDDIREHFEAFGAVERVNIVTDRETATPGASASWACATITTP